MKFRVTEQRLFNTEVSYDVEAPDEDSVEDYLDRERDEIHREILHSNIEIVNVEQIDG